jgi:hypothetical protein
MQAHRWPDRVGARERRCQSQAHQCRGGEHGAAKLASGESASGDEHHVSAHSTAPVDDTAPISRPCATRRARRVGRDGRAARRRGSAWSRGPCRHQLSGQSELGPRRHRGKGHRRIRADVAARFAEPDGGRPRLPPGPLPPLLPLWGAGESELDDVLPEPDPRRRDPTRGSAPEHAAALAVSELRPRLRMARRPAAGAGRRRARAGNELPGPMERPAAGRPARRCGLGRALARR